MKITDIRTRVVRSPLREPFATSLSTTTYVQSVVVSVHDDDGCFGLGEAPQAMPMLGESVASAAACLEGPLAAVVLGRNPADRQDLCAAVASAVLGNTGAKGAMDVALHDLQARQLGISLPRFLGTSTHDVDTDVSLSAGEADGLAAAARARVAEGFTAIKLKVGSSAESDVSRVLAVREAIGPGVRLSVDANQGWTVKQAIRVIRALEDAEVDLEFVEQPVSSGDIEGLARVTRAVQTPVMADESLHGLRSLTTLIRAEAVDAVNLKISKCGGLSTAIAMHALASAHGLGTLVGSFGEGPIGVGAAASFAAAYGTTFVPDLDAAWWLRDGLLSGEGLSYDHGTLRLPDMPGLGIETTT